MTKTEVWGYLNLRQAIENSILKNPKGYSRKLINAQTDNVISEYSVIV